MPTADCRRVLKLVVRSLARGSGIPLSLYERDESGRIVAVVQPDETIFPAYCQQVWRLENGLGRDACDGDMRSRAEEVFRTGKKSSTRCHAGLTNTAVPVELNGSVAAVLLYATTPQPGNEAVPESALRVRATEQELLDLRRLAKQESSGLSEPDWDSVENILTPLLSALISGEVDKQQQESSARKAALHDLQMILQTALAYAEQLYTAAGTKSPYGEMAVNILGAIDNCVGVLLRFAQGEYLPKDYRFQKGRIGKLIERSLLLCRAQADRKGITIFVDVNEKDVEFSEEHLQIALTNLIHNAVKYSYRKATGSERYVRIIGGASATTYEIEIINFGVGIEQDEIPKVFGGGYQGRLTRKEYRSGAGVGLALTKEIIERHRGTISVTSKPVAQEGSLRPYITRFTVSLPLTQVGKWNP